MGGREAIIRKKTTTGGREEQKKAIRWALARKGN